MTFLVLSRGKMKIDEQIKQICRRFKVVRESSDLSQIQFGDLLKVKRTAVSRIETGHITPTLRHILTVSEHFNISVEWLINGRGPMHGEELPSDFGDFSKPVYEMISDIAKHPALLHSMLSHYFSHRSSLKNLPEEKIQDG
jgi:transcriptional regulator with XRE-family HTH domain